MKLLDILKCGRSVFFLNEDREWPLSVGGTAFIVNYGGRHFVLTAKHVLNLNHFTMDQFRVQYSPDENEFVPLTACYLLNGVDEEDTDQYDVAVWEVDKETLRPELFGEYQPYSLYQMDELTLFNQSADYLYRGFPTSDRDYNPESRNMRQTAVSGRAKYLGRTRYACVHELQLLALKDLNSIDGFSGSPVFQVNPDEGKFSREAFAGIFIRGSRQSERAYFLEHRRVLHVLKQISEGAVPPSRELGIRR